MIAVIALNPALDITHHVDAVDWAGVNRPAAVRARPGGKGLNVARTLHALGADVLLLGLAGGAAGESIRSGIDAAGVPAAFTATAAETRRTFAVVDRHSGDVALFNEPGPPVTEAEFGQLRARYAEAVAGCDAVVLSGSLPGGLPADTYAGLIAMAAEQGVPAVLDTSGAALLAGVAAGPAVVKPNLAELQAAVGRPLTWDSARSAGSVLGAAAELLTRGAQMVVVSLGPAGLLAMAGGGAWLAAPRPVPGNATGAGDAAVAGLALGLTCGRALPELLHQAAALGAAAAAAPAAGEFSPADYVRALGHVAVTELEYP